MDSKSGDGDAQEVDVGDVDLSAEPAARRMTAPPPLPAFLPGPSAAAAAPAAPAAVAGQTARSQPPPTALGVVTPPSPQRGPLFFVGLIVAFLVVGLGVGAAVMLSRSKPPAASQAAPSASRAPAVITIPVVDMDDEPDAGH
jgi:hypothetical protein